MFLPRSLFNGSAPEPRSKMSNNPTLLFSWWCTIFSIVIIGLRVAGRYSRNKRIFREDQIMALAIVPLCARMAFIHPVLLWGTNNVNVNHLTDPIAIHHREIGARLVLPARICYALFIWMAKYTVSEFLKRMTCRYWKNGYETCLRAMRIFLVATFFGVVIAALGECQPFEHYWQVIPDPGPKCRQGYAHLFTMGVLDIITDILLVVFPIPIIWKSGMPAQRKVSLIILFSSSIILVGITAARIPTVVAKHGLQQFRTVFASIEILAAVAVSNFIVIGSFLRDRGPKKSKYKFGSMSDSMDRRSSTRRPTLQAHWGSDEDLVRDIGYGKDSTLADDPYALTRPRQVADINTIISQGPATKFPGGDWQFPTRETEKATQDSLPKEDVPVSPRSARNVMMQRRVSFFDVGGLLEDGGLVNNAGPSPTEPSVAHELNQDLEIQQGSGRGQRATVEVPEKPYDPMSTPSFRRYPGVTYHPPRMPESIKMRPPVIDASRAILGSTRPRGRKVSLPETITEEEQPKKT